MTIPLTLLGYGRMGQAIERIIPDFPGLSVQAIKKRGKDSKQALKGAGAAIDFSVAECVEEHVSVAASEKVPLLIGVTGLSSKTHQKIQEAAAHIPLCYAPNTSIGIAVMHHLTQKAAALLADYDIEICETHHKQKVDAPSGTALHLGQAAAAGRSIPLDEAMIYPHTEKRKEGQIGFAVMRGGAVTGDHHVNFFGSEDIITLSHRSLSRDLFARGALVLAEKLARKDKGLYKVSELLGLY